MKEKVNEDKTIQNVINSFHLKISGQSNPTHKATYF